MRYLFSILTLVILVVSPALAQNYTLNAFLKHDGDIEGVAFSEDGQTLASMGTDRVLHYWNPHTEKPQPHAEISAIDRWSIDASVVPEGPHALPVNTFDTIRQAVSFPGVENPDGLLASGSSDKTIWLQGFSNLRPLFRIQEQGEVWAVAFSPDGQMIASAGDFAGIHLWDLNTISPAHGTIEIKSTLAASTARVEGLAFSPDGQTLAVATGKNDGEAIHLWDLRTEQRTETLIAVGVPIRKVAFSPDGQMIAAGASSYSKGDGRNVLLWKRGPLSSARIPHSVELDGPEIVTALNKDFTFTVTVKNVHGSVLENVVVMLNNPGAPTDWEHSHPTGGWTDSKGKATFTLRFYDVGKHDIEVSVLNRATRAAALRQQFIDSVEVPKPHFITPEDTAPKYVEELGNYRDTFVVKSIDGQALEGFQVRISTAGVSDTVFTDNEGKATCNLRMSSAGTYDVHVTVHDYWGSKVWLQNTFANRISVGLQCDTEWTEPNSKVFSEHRKMVGRANGFVALGEDLLCALFDDRSYLEQLAAGYAGEPLGTASSHRAIQQAAPTSSLMPCIRWTPTETVVNDLGTTVITVAFLNGTSAEKDEVMDTIRNGWEQHANIHFVRESDPSKPSDIRIKFHYSGSTNNSAPGITIPILIADKLYSTIHSNLGNSTALGVINFADGLVGWIPGVGVLTEEITNAVATTSSAIGIVVGRTVEAAVLSGVDLAGYLKEETMKLTHGKKSPAERKGTILHEFGHALGFHHLQNNPAFPFDWKDREAIYKHYMDRSNPWEKSKIDNNIFDKVKLPLTATFDPDSIMAYTIRPEWIKAPEGASEDLKKLADKGIERKYLDENGNYVGLHFDTVVDKEKLKAVLSDGDKKAVSVVYGPPQDAYLVKGKLKIFGLDEDCPLKDSTNSTVREFQCVVAPQEEFSTIRLSDFYAGNEVRVEIAIGARNIVSDEIEMKATVRLFEGIIGTQLISTDEEDEETEPFSVPIDGSKLPDKVIRVENPKGICVLGCCQGGDYATVTLQEFRCIPFISSNFVASAPSAASIIATESRPNIPDNTALLANYPNPFNPETWIPYQLAKPAEVTLNIYSVDGKLVRALALGHQAAAVYHSKARAAYWDGRNELGERVASGLYFYTLTVGDFVTTRKMLIMK